MRRWLYCWAVQIDWLRALGNKVRVDEAEVGELILGIVVDVLGHVPIQHFKCLDVGGTAAASGDLAVLDTSQFVVLLPEIGFEDFGRRQEPENVYVALGETTTSCFGQGRERYPPGQQPGAEGSCSSDREPFEQKGTAAGRSSQECPSLFYDFFFLRVFISLLHE